MPVFVGYELEETTMAKILIGINMHKSERVTAAAEALYAEKMYVVLVKATRLPPLQVATVATRHTTYTRY